MTDTHTQADDARGLLVRGVAAVGIGAGLAWFADFAFTRLGVTLASPTAWIAVAGLIVLATASGIALGRSRGRARSAGRSIEMLSLAHDLRAPLATARTLLQLLQSGAHGNLTAEAMDTATRASTAVARAQAVVERELRTVPIEVPATDLEGVLDRVLASIAGGIAQSGAVIERGELPTVRADAIALERVLVNLVANSIAHARPGQPPHIEVGAQQEGRGWLISVRDNGPGMPDQVRDRAFEPGVRGFAPDGPTGFGLGLATVRRLVEQQGGRAWIDPDTTDGTCVRMLLPAA